MSLHVVSNVENTKADPANIYMDAFIRAIKSAELVTNDITTANSKELIKMVHLGVKVVNLYSFNSSYKNERYLLCNLANAVKLMIKEMTPSDFENVFPISKDYDGDKYGVKDYYYTKKYLEKFDPNKKIGENFGDFLWNYHNWCVSEFMVNLMSSVDDILEVEGEQTIFEKFCEEKGLTIYSLYTDGNGKRFIQNNDTGEIARVRKPKPRYLNVVK